MKHEFNQTATETAPSAEFVEAISRFFDTDPSDLLLELGYYTRVDSEPSSEMANMAVQQN